MPGGYLDKPVLEVYPESMVAKVSGRPIVLEAYGLPEKSENPVRLPLLFPLKERAVVYTHNWYAPIIYQFDEERGTVMLRDVLPASPSGRYVVETIGGERIKKQAQVGIVYVYTKPLYVNVGETYSGLTKEGLMASLSLRRLEIRVSDIAKFIVEMWRRHGVVDFSRVVEEVKKAFRKHAERLLPSTEVRQLLSSPSSVGESVAERLSPILSGYGLELLSVDAEPVVDREVYEYYFWHLLHELPPEYTYLLRVIRMLPESLEKNVPRAVEILVLSILARHNERLLEEVGYANVLEKLAAILASTGKP